VPRRLAALLAVLVTTVAAAFAPDVEHALGDSKYVYIQSERKSGEMGKTAEIWFFHDAGAVYVGTPPTSWRVRRIKAERPRARIAVGKPDGPSFMARGEVVHDAAVEAKMMAAYAQKYPDGWSRFEQKFRDGFKDGSRVLVRYTPLP
jgi:hypothetical protein